MVLVTVCKSLSSFCYRPRIIRPQMEAVTRAMYKIPSKEKACTLSSKADDPSRTPGDLGKENDDEIHFDEGGKEGDNILKGDLPPGLEPEMVDMWNKDAPKGPEWGGPRGYEPTKYGDWARNGRVSDF